jgi:hypothetical protein
MKDEGKMNANNDSTIILSIVDRVTIYRLCILYVTLTRGTFILSSGDPTSMILSLSKHKHRTKEGLLPNGIRKVFDERIHLTLMFGVNSSRRVFAVLHMLDPLPQFRRSNEHT